MIEEVLKVIEQALELGNKKGAYTLLEARVISEKAEQLKAEFNRLKNIEYNYTSEREAQKNISNTDLEYEKVKTKGSK
ncbi:hypothetical protein N356_gp104 [Cellulophaga phage phi14:2]|nr:hypothetical protein N356_gp104 [Cellulophaga phage phi14:2]